MAAKRSAWATPPPKRTEATSDPAQTPGAEHEREQEQRERRRRRGRPAAAVAAGRPGRGLVGRVRLGRGGPRVEVGGRTSVAFRVRVPLRSVRAVGRLGALPSQLGERVRALDRAVEGAPPGDAARAGGLPKPADIVALVLEVETRVRRLLDRGDDHQPPKPAPLLLQCAGLDPVAAARVPRAGPQPPNAVPKAKRLCARTEAGFDLHAAVRIAARDGAALERLARYIARPPIPYDRVHLLPDGRVELELKRARANGARALVFEPVVFIARVASRPTLASPSRRALLRSPLAALLPPPRSHTLRFHGVFASRHALRARVVPAPPNPKRSRRPTAPKRPARMGWAHLLARVWKIDVLACPRPGCGGRLRLVAALRAPGAITAVLAAVALAETARAQPSTPSRAPPREHLVAAA